MELKTNKINLLKKFHNHFIGHPETPKILSKRIGRFFFKPSGRFRYNEDRVFAKPAKNVEYDLVIITGQHFRRK